MIELRPTRPEDLPSLARLFEQGFGHGLSPATWEWKYRALPGESRSLVAVTPDDEVTAHAGALALEARWGSPENPSTVGRGPIWQLVDFVGSPRRGGLRPPMVDLGRALLEDLPRPGDAPWIFGFPSRRHFGLGARTFGYRPLGGIARWSGPIPELGDGLDSERSVETSDHWEPWMARVTALERGPGVLRDPAFLNWRYHARPERYYRFYRLPGPGLAVFAFAGKEALAVELWPPSEGTAAEVLAPVAADLRASGLERWSFWEPLEPAGWLGTLPGLRPDGEIFVGFRRAGGAAGMLDEMQGFHYRMGDYDLV